MLKITVYDIRYKNYSNPNGPVYIIDKKKVVCIKYKNGEVDSLDAYLNTKIEMFNGNIIHGHHTIGINLFDLSQNAFTLDYEYFLKNRKWSLIIPMSIGFNSLGRVANEKHLYDENNKHDFFYYNPNKIFSSGLGIKFYPHPERLIKLFMGIAFETGTFEYFYLQGTQPFPSNNFETKKANAQFYSGLIILGGKLKFSKHFKAQTLLGFGSAQSVVKTNRYRYFIEYTDTYIKEPQLRLGFSIGYEF
nr:hypothetical protein [Bacteroidota bacterium]